MLLLTIVTVFAAGWWVISSRIRLPNGVTAKTLWMSGQWLAEYRASHT